MSVPNNALKDRLRLAMDLKDMRAIELSEKTGIPKSAISQYLSGYAKPKQDRIYLIAKALDINEVWLMGYDVPMERQTGGENEQKESLADVDHQEAVEKAAELFSRLSEEEQQQALTYIEFLLHKR